MIYRRLNYNDLVQINELIDLRWNQIRKKRNSQHDQLLKERIKKYISLSEDIDNKTNIEGLCQVVGCFDNNNTLISFLTQKFWKEVPVYYIGNMVVRPNISKLYNVKLMGLANCIDKVVKFAESKNYFKWYWITEAKGWNKREEEWFKNSQSFRRYHIFIDSMYNVGETGQFKYQNNMIGEFGVNTTVAIKYAVLKPKFLYNSFKNKGYLKDDFLPIQYSNLEEKDITYREINNFEEIYTVTKNESNMLMNKEYYKQNFPDIAKGEYKHFGAFEDEKLIGTSSMIKYFDTEKNKNKIYHLWSWTHSDFRRKGVWLNLMKTKAKYIEQNAWCEDNTTNFVTVSNDDYRYKNIGWLEAYKINKVYKENIISKTIWYSFWKNYKKL